MTIEKESFNTNHSFDLSYINEIKKLVDYSDQDRKNLKKMIDSMPKNELNGIIEKFYGDLLKFDYPKSFFSNEHLLERVKQRQVKYFNEFFTDVHDQEFFKSRMELGLIHERIGLDNNWYLASYYVFFAHFIDSIEKEGNGKINPEILKSFSKLMLLDIGSVVSSYILAREQIINAQASEVIELSSPILSLTEDIIVIPLLGTLDSARAFQIMEKILNSIQEKNSKVIILDITGVPLLDTATGANLVRTVKAIRLMGSECILTGVRPILAQTIVELGIDLQSMVTRNTLADGFVEALKLSKK
jgi:rsbT co-antagonist protein RsbR